MAGTDKVTIYRGEDVDLNFTMDPVEDITGWTISFTVEGVSKTAKLITKAASVVSGPAGTFKVSLTDAETDSLVAGTYQYDAWRTDAGAERALAVGDFEVLDSARIPV